MLKIRMQRVGRKHEPVFRLVLTDSQNGPKSGKFLEILGSYDARKAEKAELNADRVKHWLSHGAQASATAHNLLVAKDVIQGKKINVLPAKIISAARTPKAEPMDSGAQAETNTNNMSDEMTNNGDMQNDEMKKEGEEMMPEMPATEAPAEGDQPAA